VVVNGLMSGLIPCAKTDDLSVRWLETSFLRPAHPHACGRAGEDALGYGATDGGGKGGAGSPLPAAARAERSPAIQTPVSPSWSCWWWWPSSAFWRACSCPPWPPARPGRAACSAKTTTNNLVTGWLMYADEHSQRLAYNLAGAATRTNLNWAAGSLDWELTSDNTNLAFLTMRPSAPMSPGYPPSIAVLRTPFSAPCNTPPAGAAARGVIP